MWVYVDDKTGMPARLPDSFHEHWAASAEGRKVRANLTHDDPPEGVDWQPWPVRSSDHDVLDHMNNAAYWAPVVDALGGRRVSRAEIEYRTPVSPGAAVLFGGDGERMWLRASEDGAVHASMVVQFA